MCGLMLDSLLRFYVLMTSLQRTVSNTLSNLYKDECNARIEMCVWVCVWVSKAYTHTLIYMIGIGRYINKYRVIHLYSNTNNISVCFTTTFFRGRKKKGETKRNKKALFTSIRSELIFIGPHWLQWEFFWMRFFFVFSLRFRGHWCTFFYF